MKQGTPTGIFGGEFTKTPEPDIKKTIIGQLKASVKKMVKTFLTMGLILAAESAVIWAILNYTGSFSGDPVSFGKVFFLLFIIRLVFRNTILDK